MDLIGTGSVPLMDSRPGGRSFDPLVASREPELGQIRVVGELGDGSLQLLDRHAVELGRASGAVLVFWVLVFWVSLFWVKRPGCCGGIDFTER